MPRTKPDFLNILRTLAEYKIDFIVVGGICAVLHGAPISTFDLDVVHSRNPENIERLAGALKKLNAHYRESHIAELKPGVSHLAAPGHQLLMTHFGPLDLLGTIGKGHDYKELMGDTEELQITRNFKVRVLNLRTLIKMKEETGREQDKAVLPLLRRTLKEKSKH